MAVPSTKDAPLTLGEIRFLAALSDRAGVDRGAVLAAAGEPDGFFESPDDTPVSLATFFRLMQHFSDAAGDETVTASARPLRPGTAQLVLDGVVEGMSIAAAMTHIANAYNVVHAGDYNRVHERGDRIIYAIDDRDFPFLVLPDAASRHAFMESALLFLHAILCELATAALADRVLLIETRRPAQAGPSAFLSPWRSPIGYGQGVYAIHYGAEVAHLPVRAARETAFAHAPVYRVVAENLAASTGAAWRALVWSEQVRRVLRAGARGQDQAARALGLSAASLRRRLGEEGVTFRSLKSEILDDRAKHLLGCGHTVREVAELLDFSDARSFARAFKARNGMTPTAYQLALMAAGSEAR